ncbi:MAG: SDR family oxidoreductase [Armatimonadota bacterium]
MDYVVAGGTSGTGVAVVRRLAQWVGAEHITCLIRAHAQTDALQQLGVHLHEGDVTDPATLGTAVHGDVIYLDMTHPRYYLHSIPILLQAGVRRAFFVTTTGIFSHYHRCAAIYQHGEEHIRQSGLTYTILRPSMIYGTPRDKNMHRLIRVLDRTLVFPLFNAGRSLMQPVYVEDLAAGIVAAMASPRSADQAYNLAGPTGICYREIVETILHQLNRRVVLVPVPTWLAYTTVKGLQWLPGFPINDEQVLRLQEDKVFDISKAGEELDYTPRAFDEGISQEIEEMREAGLLSVNSPAPAAAGGGGRGMGVRRRNPEGKER